MNDLNNNGEVEIVGGGGVGALSLTDGTLTSTNLSAVGIGIGGEGRLTVTGQNTNLNIMEADADSSASLAVGVISATGTLSVEDGARLGLTNTTGFNSGLTVGGNDDGEGTLNVNAATVSVSSDNAFLNVGFAERSNFFSGTGTATIENGAAVQLQGGQFSGAQIFNGTVLIDDSTLDIDGDETFFNVGRGGEGSALITNGSTVTLDGVVSGSFLTVGRDLVFDTGAASLGTLTVEDGSELTLTADAGAVDGGEIHVRVGRTGAEGILNIDDAALRATSQTDFAGLSLGVLDSDGTGDSGGDGEVNITNGSIVEFRSESDTAFVNVGADADNTGRFNIDSSTLNLSSGGDIAELNVGRNGSTGTVTASGSTIRLDGPSTAVNVGIDDGGAALLRLTGGSSLTLSEDSQVLIGSNGRLESGASLVNVGSGTLETSSGAAVRLLDEGSTSVIGNVTVQAGTDIEFEFSDDGNGALTHTGTSLVFTGPIDIAFDALDGFEFEEGTTHRLVTTNAVDTTGFGLSPDLIENRFSVNGQSEDFGFAFVETRNTATTLEFLALNNGGGSGEAVLDLASTADGVTFTYDTTTEVGSGSSANLDVVARNVDRVVGSALADMIIIEGNDGLSAATGDGDDTIQLAVGNNVINGNGGFDRAIYSGAQSEFMIEEIGDTFFVTRDGRTDELTNIESIQFNDSVVTPNTPPVVQPLTLTLDEDTAVASALGATDEDGDTLTFDLGTGPENGTATVESDGSFTFTPDADFNGTDSFTFTANDGVDSVVGTVDIVVNSVPETINVTGASGPITTTQLLDSMVVDFGIGERINLVTDDFSSLMVDSASGALIAGDENIDLGAGGDTGLILVATDTGADIALESSLAGDGVDLNEGVAVASANGILVDDFFAAPDNQSITYEITLVPTIAGC